MAEQQNIEYKQSWHDDYLKTIVGFANSQGGTIYIGRNDNGKVVGVADHDKLLEILPNKIRDLLGIMPQVNRLEESGLHYIEIDRQKQALRVWKEEGEITTGKYRQKFRVTDRTARRDLTELVALGLLEKKGDKKSSKYLFKK